MIFILNRENVTSTVVTDKTFIPKVYTKTSLFKSEHYVLEKVDGDKAYYEFSFERSHVDGLVIR